MAGINFAGLASGLDTDLLIESLLVSNQRRVDKIQEKIDSGNARKTALNRLNTQISSLQTELEGLGEDIFGNRQITSGDSKIITAEAESSSALGNYEITVNNLAQRSVVTVGQAQSSATATIGAGTIDLKFQNADDISVTLADGNATLTDLATAINDEYGETVQASVVEVSSGSFQLVLSSRETGADLNILDESDGASSSSLSGFNGTFLDAGQANSGGISRTQDGEDASITLDGITITRSSNEIDDILDGVTFQLRGESTGGPTNLEIDTDLEAVEEGLNSLITKYNDLKGEIDSLTNAETGRLANDSDLRGLRNNLQSLFTRFVSNIDTLNVRDDGSAGFTSLSQIGFETDQKTGELTLDSKEFREALEENFDEVQNLFLGGSTTSNPNISVTNALSTAFSGTVSLDLDSREATIDGTVYSLIENEGILSFETDSPFSGLIFDANGASGTATIEIVAGLAETLQDETDRYSSFSGIINDRTTSIDDRNRSLEKDLDTARDRLENERTRLTSVFAQAEQAINTLQGLSASLGAQSSGFSLGG